MSREIKFRAWDTQDQQWLEGTDFYVNALNGLILQYNFSGDEWVDVTHFQVMQYTGLKDKNGVEIYEGDIVRQSATKGVVVQGTVKWHAEWGCYFIGDASQSAAFPGHLVLIAFNDVIKDCRVIGNIYENPELLKGGDA